MKKIRLLLTLSLLSFVVFTACSNEEVTAPTQLDFDSPQFAIIDMNDLDQAVENLSMEKEMGMNPQLFNYTFLTVDGGLRAGNPSLNGNPWMQKFDLGKHLGRIFRILNLNNDQKLQVRDLMKSYHDKNKLLVRKFHEANKSIVEQANVERKAILEQVKNGTLTRETARPLLEEINKKTREAIAANPVTIEVKAELCANNNTLMDSIKNILNEDQLKKWDDFVSRMKNPC